MVPSDTYVFFVLTGQERFFWVTISQKNGFCFHGNAVQPLIFTIRDTLSAR